VAVFRKKYYNGRVPTYSGYDEQSSEVIRILNEIPPRIGDLIESFQIKDATREMMKLAAVGNRYFDYSAPWRTIKENREQCDRTMATCARIVSALEIITYPFLPFTSRKIAKMLNLGRRNWAEASNPAVPYELGEVEILFEKLPEEIVIRERAKLAKKQQLLENKKELAVITIDDFKKIDLRIARIKAAEAVPGTSKLVKLIVDLGTEERQIVAGIGSAYQPATLIGKEVVVVANLQPAKIRGVESSGMLLAAVDGTRIALVVPDQEVQPGTPVS
jgi:methionyl-tRNA synthetase